jgi:hypothetical protein
MSLQVYHSIYLETSVVPAELLEDVFVREPGDGEGTTKCDHTTGQNKT